MYDAIKTLCALSLLALPGCADDLDAELMGEDELTLPSADHELTHGTRGTAAVAGFDVDISIAGDNVVLDWAADGPQGDAVSVFVSTDAQDLLDLSGSLPAGVTEIALPPGTTSFTDTGAAHHGQATPDTFYRVVVSSGQTPSASTMLMKITTEMAPGYNKLGMCMIDGPTQASDIVAQLGGSVTGVWGWDAVSQSYVGWTPADGVGSASDFALPFGGVVSAQVDGSTPAFQSLVGVVPTDEAFAVSGQPGYNWSLLPVLYDGPASAAYWVDQVGYWGMGLWNNLTQSAQWYWGPGYGDFSVDGCQPFYTYLSDDACTSNADCGADSFCDFDQAAACGDVAAGLCKARPIGCEYAPAGEVCGCDGTTYPSACEAELAGASIADDQAACPQVVSNVYDAAAAYTPGVVSQDEVAYAPNSCSPGFELISTDEANARNAELCAMLGTWDIIRLADNGSMGGPGYGCVVFEDDDRQLGGALCTTANPNGDNGWHYLHDVDGNGSYVSLEYGANFWGTTTWFNPACTEATVWEPHPLFPDRISTHPASIGCAGWTTLAWEAPADGPIDIQVDVATGDPGCVGQGVDLELRDTNGGLLWSQSAAFGVDYQHTDSGSAIAGDRVYLRVNQGAGGTWCDSTYMNMTVTQYE